MRWKGQTLSGEDDMEDSSMSGTFTLVVKDAAVLRLRMTRTYIHTPTHSIYTFITPQQRCNVQIFYTRSSYKRCSNGSVSGQSHPCRMLK